MLAYFCKYVPEELLQAFGTELVCLEPHVTNFTQADALMHPNMCSFSKAVLEEFEKQDYEGMVFTSCCDSSRRLYDILCQQFPDKFFFCLDLPRKINDFAVTLYTKQLQKLIDAYADFSGKTFSDQKLLEICRECADEQKLIETGKKHDAKQKTANDAQNFDATAYQTTAPVDHTSISSGLADNPTADSPMNGLHIALVGARPGSEIRQLITDHQAEITLDLTCTGIQRSHLVAVLTAGRHNNDG